MTGSESSLAEHSLSESFVDKQVRDLFWVLARPGVLNPMAPALAGKAVDETRLRNRTLRRLEFLKELDLSPSPLHAFLAGIETFGRLGRYFERLLEFGLREVLQVSRLEMNIPIRDTKRTLGELDLLIDTEASGGSPEHWEASVKFYLCIAETPPESVQTRFYLGTVVEDRLDLKLTKLFGRQLDLAATPAGLSALSERGWSKPAHSFALMKGLFYYPSHLDWKSTPLPTEIAPEHPRGWWTTSGRLEIPQSKPGTFYTRLGLFHWLAELREPVDRSLLMTHAQLEDFVRAYFEGPVTPQFLRRRELTVAEVEVEGDEAGPSAEIAVREIARGHIVHADWPELARGTAGV